MSHTSFSAGQKLASLLLGQPVDQWIAAQRKAGLSWRLIARALYERTNGQVDVTYETLRNWSDRTAA
jgi:hypothetical protein